MFVILHAQSNEFKSVTRDNCTFYGGKAQQGGGIFIVTSETMVSDLLPHFKILTSDNSATSGGGLCIKAIHAQVEAVVENCAAVHIAGHIAGHIQSEFESKYEFTG